MQATKPNFNSMHESLNSIQIKNKKLPSISENSNEQISDIKYKLAKNVLRQKSLLSLITAKNSSLFNEYYYIDNRFDYMSSKGNNDWSKQSCSTFMTPTEVFLEKQRKREKSSRRRCCEKLKVKVKEYNKKESERLIKEYDDKINLTLLLKKSKDFSGNSSGNSSAVGGGGGSNVGNYRALIAQETVRKSQICERCMLKNRKQEEQFLKNCLECTMLKEKFEKPKLPRILPKLKLYDPSDDFITAAPFSRKRNLSNSKENLSNSSGSLSNIKNDSSIKVDGMFEPNKPVTRHRKVANKRFSFVELERIR